MSQRFVKLLRLADYPGAAEAYKKAHSEVWPEIIQGIREVGVELMDIYVLDGIGVMIMEVEDGVDVDAAMERLAGLPRQAEWERYVSQYQQCSSDDTSAGKWKQMEQIFRLP